MNFHPLPQSVQDTFNAAIQGIADDSQLFPHADQNFFEKIDDAMDLCRPYFNFPGWSGLRHRQMQEQAALKQVLGSLLLAPDVEDLERLYEHLTDYLRFRPWAKKCLGNMCRELKHSTTTGQMGHTSPELIECLENLDDRI